MFRNIFSRLVKQFFVNQQMQYKIFVLGNNTSFITIRPRIDIFQNWSFLSKKKKKKEFFFEFIALLLPLFGGSLKRNAIPCTCFAAAPCYVRTSKLRAARRERTLTFTR